MPLAIRALVTLATAVVGWRVWLAVLRPVMSGYAGEISADAQRAINEGRYLVDESAEQEARGQRTAASRSAACAASIPSHASVSACARRFWRRARCATGSWIRAST